MSMMLAVLEVRLNELLAFLSGDDDEMEEDSAGEAEESAEAFLGEECRGFF